MRINTIEGSTGGISTDWEYYTIESVDGTEITVDSAVSAATGYYYAEYGIFYSGPGKDNGVSENCLQADPDFTNNPLDHDGSASDLQDELQGLAQVNSSAGCLEVKSEAIWNTSHYQQCIPVSLRKVAGITSQYQYFHASHLDKKDRAYVI